MKQWFTKIILVLGLVSGTGITQAKEMAGLVSAATPEAAQAGADVLSQGGNAIDAAIATSLALTVSEPAGSGIGGQTVMLIYPANGNPVVIHGTTWSPSKLPENVTKDQLRKGRTASTVPSTLKVLDLALNEFGSGNLKWSELVAPAIKLASDGVVMGPFRHRAFRFYGDALKEQDAARKVFTKEGATYQIGDRVKQPILAKTLKRIAKEGAADFYTGKIAQEIATDMAENGGWITADDLANFPTPKLVVPLKESYRGYDVFTLPPPFGGWIMLQTLGLLEKMPAESLSKDDDVRRAQLIDAVMIAQRSRKNTPVSNFVDYAADVSERLSDKTLEALLDEETGSGETTHFTVADTMGNVVSVTQSIDSYFGSKVMHPTLGFLYNNYMQSFRLEDDGSPYVLKAKEMPLSSMSASVITKEGKPVLALGSPASARIISSVAQTISYWIDVAPDVEKAVGAYRVHGVPDNRYYIEGPGVGAEVLKRIVERGGYLARPAYGVSDSHYDPYFGGIHALAVEKGQWTGAADPRRDGAVRVGYKD